MATCPNCQQQLPEISEGKFCPFCGAPIASSIEPPRYAAESNQPSSETSSPEESTPGFEKQQNNVHWEDRQRLGFLAAFGQTWSDSTFRPTEFFHRLPKTGNIGSALLYAFIIGTTAGILSLFWDYLFWDSLTNIQELENMLNAKLSRDFLGFAALLVPFFTIIGIFFVTFIYHICLLITGSGRHGWEATFRGFCYSQSPLLFVLVPGCGAFVALVWIFVLIVIGWRELHQSTTGRVLFAAFLPFIFCCGVNMLLFWSLAGIISGNT
jgi:endogenous inhibitor of DNA gyrase (YacG/DUF329 family)